MISAKVSHACFVLATAALLLLVMSNQIWSGSVDFAHHYTLVERLLEPGGVSTTPDPTLREMQVYPRLGHLIATVVAVPFDSAIVGMALTATASLIAIWIAIASILSGFRPTLRSRVLLATACSIAIGGGALKLQIFGTEIVGNYFFSQLLGQAALLIAMATALRLEQRSAPRWLLHGFLAVSIVAIESIHLLPAIEGLGLIGVLLLSDVVDSWRNAEARRAFARPLLAAGLVWIVTAIAVVAHPTFAVMRSISENNGDLQLPLLHTLTALLALALVVLGFSITLILRYSKTAAGIRDAALPLKYIGALGVSCSVLLVLQWLALHGGQGSEYACKKYVFALTSIFLVELPLLFIATPGGLNAMSGSQQERTGRLIHSVTAVAFIIVAVLSATPRHSDLSVRSLRNIEHQTKAIEAFRVARDIKGTAIAVHLPSSMPMLDYMFSIATLKAPRDELTYDLLRGKAPQELDRTSMIVTARDDRRYDVPQCRFPAETHNLVAIDARCFQTALGEKSRCRDAFDFTSAGTIEPALLSGFSAPETEGTWTDATNASFKCAMPPPGAFRPRFVDVTASAFVPTGHAQRFTLSLGDSDARDTVTFLRPGEVKVVTLPLDAVAGHWIHLNFSLPDAISPAAAGISVDSRVLGVQVRAIRFR